MKAALLALMAAGTPLDGNALFALYAQGHYEDAMREGAQANNAAGLAVAARAALADAMMRQQPCLSCLKRGEAFARRAVAADGNAADAHVWLAASLGYEARIVGLMRARLDDDPAQAKEHLEAALKIQPDNAYGLAALGGWHVEVVKTGGDFLAGKLYGASRERALALFDHAIKVAPRNVAVRYQIALSLAGYDPASGRVESELEAALHAAPETAYEKFIQARAGELLALLKRNDRDGFDEKVRVYQGYP